MPFSLENAVPIILGNLTPPEVSGSVVYVAETPIYADTHLEFPHISITAPWDAFIAFVDRDPMANWSHSCRYLLVNREDGEIRSFEAQLPPFTSDRQIHWREVYRAPSLAGARHLDR
jgi:hypothetical protein